MTAVIILIAVVGSLALAAVNFFGVKKLDPGLPKMVDIADAIKEGADAFLRHEYKVISMIAIVIVALLWLSVSWYTGVAFLIGAQMSASAAWVGMKIAVIANVRVSNTARTTKSLGKTLKVAFRGGSVMGLCVGGFALLGLWIVYVVFGEWMGQMHIGQIRIVTNWMGVSFIPFTMTVSGYALGCSVIAMFFRVGGGIFTKAADMGADLVGKTEAHIPEDDPRNPATIADNVGDNVGDVAGLGADLLESFVGALISGVVLSSYMYYTTMTSASPLPEALVAKLMTYPVLFASFGIISCILGILFLLVKKVSDHPRMELNYSTWVSAGSTIVINGVFSYFYFKDEAVWTAGFRFGPLSAWYAAILGIVSGIVIGLIAEYYTSYDYRPTQRVGRSSLEGTALTITEGMALGMKSTALPVIVLGLAIIAADYFAGLYGVALAAIGMLSFVSATVSVDTYGPIADNAGGICEMSELEHEVRAITDQLDSVGNTTAAIGKGFAIGSAAFAALSLFASFLYSQAQPTDTSGYALILNMVNTLTLSGIIIGAALPYFFSGVLIEAVTKAARHMVQEVRRQFKEQPGILTGEVRPDYKTCIQISSAGAVREMVFPALLAVTTPIVSGFLLGPEFVGGVLLGATVSAIMLAIYTANAGGAWDNGKKYLESGNVPGIKKDSEAHAAAIIGDTVGDPLKDTVGPSLDILIKIMAVVSLIAVSIFQNNNLLELFK